MTTRNKILTSVLVVFGGIIGYFAIGVFTGGGSVDKVLESPTSEVQAQTPTTTTAPAAVPVSDRQTPNPAQPPAENGDVAELRADFVAYSENMEQVISNLADTQAVNAATIQRLAESQSTPLQTACHELLVSIVGNTETSSSSRQTSQPTGGSTPGGEGASAASSSSSSSSSSSLMFELLDNDDEGTGLGVIIGGEVVCAVVKVDTGDSNLEGAVSWGRSEAENEDQ